jgi:hypothetical protein
LTEPTLQPSNDAVCFCEVLVVAQYQHRPLARRQLGQRTPEQVLIGDVSRLAGAKQPRGRKAVVRDEWSFWPTPQQPPPVDRSVHQHLPDVRARVTCPANVAPSAEGPLEHRLQQVLGVGSVVGCEQQGHGEHPGRRSLDELLEGGPIRFAVHIAFTWWHDKRLTEPSPNAPGTPAVA